MRGRAEAAAGWWSGLDEVCDLDDSLIVGTTEVGLPGVLCRGKRVIDIAGLNQPEFLQSGFSAAALIDTYATDMIYMPHFHYVTRTRQILEHPGFEDDYMFYSGRSLRAGMAVAIRRSSPHFSELEAIFSRIQRSRRDE